jgi:H+-transporting ATPase
MASYNQKDEEQGNFAAERHRNSKAAEGSGELDEYTALQKFITTYRDPKAAQADQDDAEQNAQDAKKSGSWWKFWRAGSSSKAQSSDPGTVPDEWLNTDIKSEHIIPPLAGWSMF